ncbi:MAG: LysM peptidoglycan-binding domain-containing protein [Pseudomonadota bacterium]
MLPLVACACATTDAAQPVDPAPLSRVAAAPEIAASAPSSAPDAPAVDEAPSAAANADPVTASSAPTHDNLGAPDDVTSAQPGDLAGTVRDEDEPIDDGEPATEGDEVDDDAVVLEGAPETLDMAVSATMSHHDLAAGDFDIPVVDHPRVDKWMTYFTGPGARRFRTWLERLTRYEPLMRPMLRERGLPEDTIYLALIESGLSPRAYSRARASGYWQFIERTGAAYGLHDDFWVDQRRDPVRATDAAARHLKDLYDEFGHWHLAWAAYNAGAGKIREAIRRYETRDFFELIEHPYLRPETKDYVPKLIAAARIAKHPERYGFTDIPTLPAYAHATIDVGDATDLGLVAEGCGVDMELLVELNPELKRWATPPRERGQPGYQVRVPPGLGERCQQALDAVPLNKRLTFRHHRVRSGEVPGQIARRYGISLATMMRMNKVRDARRLRVGQDLLIPIPARVPERMFREHRVLQRPGDDGEKKKPRTAVAKPRAPKPPPRPVAPPPGTHPATHVIASGDSLWTVAQRYKVSVADLRAWNHLKKNAILQPGQALTVHVPD